jgi:hypothetical protein
MDARVKPAHDELSLALLLLERGAQATTLVSCIALRAPLHSGAAWKSKPFGI